MLITPERKVPQRSDASQNDHKSKGYPSAAAFTMQKLIGALDFLLDFLKSGSTALFNRHVFCAFVTIGPIVLGSLLKTILKFYLFCAVFASFSL